MDLNGEFYNPHKPGAAVTQVFPWGCKSAAELHADDGGISKRSENPQLDTIQATSHCKLKGLLEHILVFVIKTKNKRTQYTETFAMESTHGLVKIDPQVLYLLHLILCFFLYRFESDQKPHAPRTSHQS